MKEVLLHTVWEKEITVNRDQLAKSVGSGEVAVYATPMMIALMEEVSAYCLKQFLDPEETSVGILMNTTHSAATPEGMKVKVTAEIIGVEGKKVTFSVKAVDESDIIGEAIHERFIVIKEKFENRAQSKLTK